MSVVSQSASSIVAFKPAASRVNVGAEPGAVSELPSEWRSLGGVAASILADLDRRRLRTAHAEEPAPRSSPKAA